jgi:hypothetical protein
MGSMTRLRHTLELIRLEVGDPDRVSVAVHTLGNYGGCGVLRLVLMHDRSDIADPGRALDPFRTAELSVRGQQLRHLHHIVFSKNSHP